MKIMSPSHPQDSSGMFQSLLIDNVEELIGNYEHHSLEGLFQGTLKGFKLGSTYSESLKNLTEFASKLESPEEKWNFLLGGVASLRLFTACNWAGYTLKDENLANMSHITPCINEILDTEGEGLYPVIRHPELLTLARLLLMDGSSVIEEDAWFLDFWKLRCVSVHQECLLETSERLRTAGDEFISKIKKNVSHIENLTIRALFYLEATCFYSKYRELVKMQEHFKIATDIIGIEIEALGALGKRTKFQQNDLAQYTLDIKRKDSARNGHYNDVDEKVSDLPRDIKLDDELRLNKIKFKEEREDLNLTKIERAALITAFGVVLMSQPKDSLTLEETIPYINAILFNNDTWSLQMSALFHRSLLESNESRTVERAMMQLSTLSESLPTKDERDAYNRLNMVFVSQSLPFWKLEGSLVRLYLVLGSTKSALDLALRLELWEDVINCYHLLQLRHKAAEVIQSQLSIKETPLLWCMMGDATDDLSCYEKALEMKDGKFSRALRSLGYHYYFQKDYKSSIDYMKKSLDLNGCQQHLRLRLGFAATECEEWELAASVYRSYCIFETDNFEAWNNLANAYIKMGQKSRAWKVLQEAVKCDYENWKIWENIMTVSTDCAHFEEVIKAYNRILDLKEGKFIDTEVLEILVKAIVNDIPDSYNRPTAKNFRKPALKLFGRLSSTVLDNSDVWKLYSYLAASDIDISEEDRDYKAASLLHKAFPAAFKQSKWEMDIKNVKSLLCLGHELVQGAIKSSHSSANQLQTRQLMSSIRMTLRGLLAKIEKIHLDITTNEVIAELKNEFAVVKLDIEETLTNRINILK